MKKIILFLSILISLFVCFFVSKYFFDQNTKFQNFQLGSLTQKNQVAPEIIGRDIIKNEKITLEFDSKYDNLGTVEILFDNHNRINKDKLQFRIREFGNIEWKYQAIYDASLMDSGQYFPFGFPVINNSKDKKYEIEIKSKSGNFKDNVALSPKSSYFKAKYFFNQKDLMSNKLKLITFVFDKSREVINYFSFIELFEIVIVFILSIFVMNTIFNNAIKIIVSNASLDYLLVLLLTVYFVSHLYFVGYSQYWDSEWYWQLLMSAVSSVKYFHGSLIGLLDTIIKNFNFLGHPSMGYISVMSLGQFFQLGNVKILNFQNIILSMAAIISFYLLVSKKFPKNKLQNILITSIFAFNPLFYASSISFNLDFGVLIFTVLTFTALSYKKYMWFSIFSVFLIFSKETGMLVYFTIFLSNFIFFRNDFKKNLRSFAIPILIFIAYMYFSNWNLWNSKALTNSGNGFMFSWNNNGMFTFGINAENIKLRLFQIFVLNFNWIFSLYLILNIKSLVKIKELRTHLLTFGTFILFNLFYIVMPFARYTVLASFFIPFLFYFVKRYSNSLLILILVLVFIQTFKAIDPTSLLFYGTNKIGNNPSSPIYGFRDGLVYNSEFIFVERLNYMLSHRDGKSEGIINNVGSQYFFKNIDEVGTVENLDKIDKKYKHMEYLFVPWFSNKDKSLELLSDKFTVSFKEKIDYKGYYVEIYKVEKE